ncbi:MAG: hypothetical protein ABIR18_05830 [Chitinophagaceae bacterium]
MTMIIAATRKMLAIAAFTCLFFFFTNAQSANDPFEKASKPYRIYTSGKQITVKSTLDIKSVMVWTASGHRIIEQKNVNASYYSFTVGVNEKVFFVMLELQGDKRYTEKVGVR